MFRLQKCIGSDSNIDVINPFISEPLYDGAWLGRKNDKKSNNKIDLKIHGHKNSFSISRKSVEIIGIINTSNINIAEDTTSCITIRVPDGCNNNEGVAIRRYTTATGNKKNLFGESSNNSISRSISALKDTSNTSTKIESSPLSLKSAKKYVEEVVKPNNTAQLNTGDVLVFDHFAKRSHYQYKLIIAPSALEMDVSPQKMMGPSDTSSIKHVDVIDMNTTTCMLVTAGEKEPSEVTPQPAENCKKSYDCPLILNASVVPELVSVPMDEGESDGVVEFVGPSNTAKHSTQQVAVSCSPVRKKARIIQQRVVAADSCDDFINAVEIEIANPSKKMKKLAIAPTSLTTPPLRSNTSIVRDNSRDCTNCAISQEIPIELGLMTNSDAVSDDSVSMPDLVQSPIIDLCGEQNVEVEPPPRPRRSQRAMATAKSVKSTQAMGSTFEVTKKENKQGLNKTSRHTPTQLLNHPGNISLEPYSSGMKNLVSTLTTSTVAEPSAIHQSVVNSFYRTLMGTEASVGYQILMNHLTCHNQITPDDVLGNIFRTALFGPKCDGVNLIDLKKHQVVIAYANSLAWHFRSYWDWELFADIVNGPLNSHAVEVWEQSALTFDFIVNLFAENQHVLDSFTDVPCMLKQTVFALRSFFANHKEVFDSSITVSMEKLEVIHSVTRLCKAYCSVAAKLANSLKRKGVFCEKELLHQCLAGIDPNSHLFVIFEDALLCTSL